MSWVKYILPVGIFILGIYLIFNKSEGLKGKSYIIFSFTLINNGHIFCKSIFRKCFRRSNNIEWNF